MTPVFIDSGYVIALLHSSDRYHQAAARWASILREQERPRVTTAAVLSELGDGFARKGRWQPLQQACVTYVPTKTGV